MKLLILNTSILGDNSASRQLTAHYAEIWRQTHPQGSVTVHDLAANPLPLLNAEIMGAWSTPAEQRTDRQQQLAAPSDELIALIEAHDELLVAAPLYNFSIPGVLKNAQDHLARAGVTFRYTESGPEGLLGKGKTVNFARTSGGQYRDTPAGSVTSLLDTYFGFLGFDIGEHIWAEGLAFGEEAAKAAINDAKSRINALAA